MIPAEKALQRLIAGNQRFVAGVRSIEALASPAKRVELVDGQEPFAIVLGCSDSRVPAEIVFDQGLGDLFVIRVAGNIVAPSQIESVEFSAAQHGAKLVVVLGHSNCAAVAATLGELAKPENERSRDMQAITGRIAPALETLCETGLTMKPDELMHHAVRANVRACVNQLRHSSATLEKLSSENSLLIVGAEYSLGTGVVEFFDNVPDSIKLSGLSTATKTGQN